MQDLTSTGMTHHDTVYQVCQEYRTCYYDKNFHFSVKHTNVAKNYSEYSTSVTFSYDWHTQTHTHRETTIGGCGDDSSADESFYDV